MLPTKDGNLELRSAKTATGTRRRTEEHPARWSPSRADRPAPRATAPRGGERRSAELEDGARAPAASPPESVLAKRVAIPRSNRARPSTSPGRHPEAHDRAPKVDGPGAQARGRRRRRRDSDGRGRNPRFGVDQQRRERHQMTGRAERARRRRSPPRSLGTPPRRRSRRLGGGMAYAALGAAFWATSSAARRVWRDQPRFTLAHVDARRRV